MPFRFQLLISISILFSSIVSAAPMALPAAPNLAAKSYILQDFDSGEILAEKAADLRIEPASITKIMTAYIIFDALKTGKLSLQDQVLISEKAWRNPGVPDWQQGSRMFADVNSKVLLEDLLRGLIVQSGNDASVALAEHMAGTEEAFAGYMNDYGKRLGLTGSRFENSTGWPTANHYSTARDIASLSRALIRDFPQLYKMFAEKTYTYNNIKQSNRNALLWKDESVDGIKTGSTEAAGYCLATSAERDGMRLIAVVMGADSKKARTKYSQSLLGYGFRFYETHKLFAAGDVLKATRVWQGDQEEIQLGLQQDLFITIPRGQYKNLKPLMEVKKSIVAPIEKHSNLGLVKIQLQDKILYEQPLIALNAVNQGGFFRRLIDRVAQAWQ